jgi:hypothetical protein
MIRFACPTCKGIFEAPDHCGGGKVACPGCGQRLQIPLPPRDKTVLAPLVPHQPSVPSAVASPSATVPASATSAAPPAPPAPGQSLPWERISLYGGAAAGVALLVWLIVVLIRSATPPAGAVAEARRHTRSDAEELVKRYILNNASDPAAVTFTRWGPHITEKEMADLLGEAGLLDEDRPFQDPAIRELQGMNKLGLSFVRVCYDGRDRIFTVTGNSVAGDCPNGDGDNWKHVGIRNWRRSSPASS